MKTHWLTLAIGVAALSVAGASAAHRTPALSGPAIVVYKSPSCGCCTKWVEYLQARGFQVTAHDVDDVSPTKHRYGVPDALASCHTALVGGYVIEGHVPAEDILRLLREHPSVVGLTVPGMVTGSPGMEGGARQAYQVLSFNRQGKTAVWASH